MKMKERFFIVSLCYYTDENAPECGARVVIKSKEDLTKIPTYRIKENIYVAEAMEANDCEGIGVILEISEEEFQEEYFDEELIVF